jgi:hypothetical protein
VRSLAIVMFVWGVLNATQPFWVDSTPVYPPWIGVVILAPLNLFAAWQCWAARKPR